LLKLFIYYKIVNDANLSLRKSVAKLPCYF